MKNEIIFSLLNNIKESCEHGFLQINQRIDTLEETINKLEKKNIGGGPPSSNFSKTPNPKSAVSKTILKSFLAISINDSTKLSLIQ